MRAALLLVATLFLAGCSAPEAASPSAASEANGAAVFEGGSGSIRQSVDAFGKGEAIADGAFRLARDVDVRIVFALVDECEQVPPPPSEVRDQTSVVVQAKDGEAPFDMRLAYDAGLLGPSPAGLVYAEAEGEVHSLPCMGF